jgi:hypothetical protein
MEGAVTTRAPGALYEGLPVVIVQDWGDVTLRNLARWRDEHGSAFGSPGVEERLTNGYWVERMRRLTAEALGDASRGEK